VVGWGIMSEETLLPVSFKSGDKIVQESLKNSVVSTRDL